MADARTSMESDAEGRFETFGYEVDSHAVADAILIRLLAGGTLRLRCADDR